MSELENNSTIAETASEPEPQIDPMLLEEMAKAGILYGRKKSKTHPKMRPFIYTTRNGIEILDLPKTLDALEKAGDFLKDIATKPDASILAVGTRPAAQELIENFGKKFAMPYVTKRWLGGTLTNFKTISSRIRYYQKLKSDEATGKLDKYTKKEQLGFRKQIEKMDQFFGGLEKLERLPDALLVINANEHMTAIREAHRAKIPVVCIISTDTNPEVVEHPIPANDDGKSSITWIFGKLESKIEEGKKNRKP